MKITFIGGGNMAQAIMGGLARGGFASADIGVVEPVAEARAKLAQDFGVKAEASTAELAVLGDLIVMAVKPQQMREAAAALRPKLQPRQVVLTIAAGIRLADLARWLGGHARLIRCMPNTPALIGAGVTAAYATAAVTAEETAQAARVLQTMGKLIWVKSEALLDPVTAVSGSGPAYVFYFIEALEQAAKELGLEADAARTLALETFLGAAKLAAGSADDPATLRAKVTSKGGTTEAALATMDLQGMQQAFINAVRAANARALELGEQLGKD
jgi:pyrroline-5-carboxylate reductase